MNDEQFQVSGEETIYTDVVSAIGRMKKRGHGSEVTRVRDGELIASMPKPGAKTVKAEGSVRRDEQHTLQSCDDFRNLTK